MSIRLNKALRELNIGLQTAVGFLQKRSQLGEVKADPSFKLSDAQYEALVNAFKQDAAVREQAEQLFKKPKEKKPSAKKNEEQRDASGFTVRQKYTPLGKIDLSQVGVPKVVPASDAQTATDSDVTAKAETVSCQSEACSPSHS